MTPDTEHALLLVDDDRVLCAYLAPALADAGYRVLQAQDRAQALGHFGAQGRPELVLLDLGLPPLANTLSEGLALLDQMLRQAPDTKVIVLTGQAEDAAAAQAVRRGAFDFLPKPAALDNILLALRRAALYARVEAMLAQKGEARLHLTARLDEGPRQAASSAEEQLLRRALVTAGYNMAEAARRLGIAREHVYYYLKKYGIHRPR
jgi:DNA-binding NtrC family response regulator